MDHVKYLTGNSIMWYSDGYNFVLVKYFKKGSPFKNSPNYRFRKILNLMNRLESRRPSQMNDIKVKMPIMIQIKRLEYLHALFWIATNINIWHAAV
jgi:hypothetical protein